MNETFTNEIRKTILTGVTSTLVVLFIAVLISPYVGQFFFSIETSKLSKKEIIESGIQQAKKQMAFPHQIDEFTTITDIKGTDDSVQYYYDVRIEGAQPIDSVSLKDGFVKALCTNLQTRSLLDKDIKMEAFYNLVNSSQNYSLTATKEDC